MDVEIVQKILHLVSLVFKWTLESSTPTMVETKLKEIGYSTSVSKLLYVSTDVMDLFLQCFRSKHLPIV
jgi:hypothetical protein